MKQESMKVLFFIRKSRLKKNGEAPIFLRVTINGQLDEVRIQRSVPLKLWDNVIMTSNMLCKVRVKVGL